MKLPFKILLFFSICVINATAAPASFEVLSPERPQAFFGGQTSAVQVMFRNSGQLLVEVPLKTRLYQLSSSTVMPAENAVAWKRVSVLGGQTVLESARLGFPSVRATARFEVRWLDDAEKTIGQSVVTVFPTNLLKQLETIAGEKPPGIFDPHEQLVPLLRALNVEFVDLNEGERIETFRDALAILGPFDANQPTRPDLRKHSSTLAARGVNVVLIQPHQKIADSVVRPSFAPRPFIIVNAGPGRIVLPPHEAVEDLSTSPLAQEALLHYARLALNPNLLTEAAP